MHDDKQNLSLASLLKQALNPKNWPALYRAHRDVVLYFIFGVLTTVISFVVYYLMRHLFPDEASIPSFLRFVTAFSALFGADNNTTLPVLISWICAVTFAYVTNRFFVFQSKRSGFLPILREAGKFYAGRLLTLVVELVVMFLLVDLPGIEHAAYEFCAKLAASVVVFVLNYIISKLLVFRNPRKHE